MNPILNNRFTYLETGPELEINDLPTETQPDEVLSIREMLERHSRGIPMNGSSRQPIYYPEELGHVPDVERMDLTEISEMVEHMTARRSTLENEIKKRESEEKAAKAARQKEEKEMREHFQQLKDKSKGQEPDPE